MPDFTFRGGCEQKTMTFFFFSCTLTQSFGNQLQKKLPTIDLLNEAVYKCGTGTRGRGHWDACVGTWGREMRDLRTTSMGRRDDNDY